MAGKTWDEATEPKITPELFERRGRERRSGREVLFLRPRQHVGEPEPDGPLVRTSPPAFAVQLKPGDDCPPEPDLVDAANAFRGLIAQILGNIEVRFRCVDGVVTIAIWLDSARTQREIQARERSLRQISQLDEEADEQVAMYITHRALQALARAEFDRMLGPHYRLADDGRKSADGPIHLERIIVDLEPPKKIITRVEGFDDRPWPDVDFTARITDEITTGTRMVPCTVGTLTEIEGLFCRSTDDVDVDPGDAALAATLGLLTFPFFGIGSVFLFQLLSAGGPDDVGAGEDEGGVGCALTRLVQQPIPRAEFAALGINYLRASVTPNAVLLGGTLVSCRRTPRVTIEGPGSFTIPIERGSVAAVYRAETAETFGDLRFQWTATHARVHNPTGSSTRITFDLGGPVQNSVTESRITLTVTDGEGVLPAASKTVRIRLTSAPPPPRPRPGDDDPDRQPL